VKLLSREAKLAAPGKRVKRASRVHVFYSEDPRKGPLLKITVQIGESQSTEEHMAFQNLLSSVKKLQSLTIPDATQLPLGLNIDDGAKDSHL